MKILVPSAMSIFRSAFVGVVFAKSILWWVVAVCLAGACDQIGGSDDRLPPMPNAENFQVDRQIAFLTSRIVRNNDEPQLYYLRAKLLCEAGRFEQADSDLERALRLGGNQPEYHALRAKVLLENGEYAQGLVSAKNAEERGVVTPELNQTLGRLYFHLENWQESLKYFQRARSALPNSSQSSYYMGTIFAKQGDTTNSVIFLKEALSENPAFEPAYTALIRLYKQYEQPRVALEYASNGLQHFDPNANYCLEVASLVNELYQPDSAAFWYRKAIERDPSLWSAHLEIARYFFRKRNYTASEASYLKVISLQPNEGRAYFELGFIYEYHLTDLAKAMDAYQNAAKLDSTNTLVPWAIKRVDRKINFKNFFDFDDL